MTAAYMRHRRVGGLLKKRGMLRIEFFLEFNDGAKVKDYKIVKRRTSVIQWF